LSLTPADEFAAAVRLPQDPDPFSRLFGHSQPRLIPGECRAIRLLPVPVMKDLPTSAEAFQQEEYCVGTRQEKLIRLSFGCAVEVPLPDKTKHTFKH
jgi:hypothetical protein